MKKLLFVFAILAMFVFSCDFNKINNNDPDNDDSEENNQTGRQFWAQNIITENHYQLWADLVAEGTYCNIWVEKGSNIDEAAVEKIADAYDNNIYDKMINAFSIRRFSFNQDDYDNVMEFADAITDGDGKLTILLLDIKDGYIENVNEAYVAGYFWPGNLFSRNPSNPNSNLCDMIYIDLYPGLKKGKEEEAYKTLAHEMQHLMNLTTSIVKRSTISNNVITSLSRMDTWIDEGLSAAAEWVYSEKYDEGRLGWFNNNGIKYDNSNEKRGSGLIDKGNNFFVWGNREESDQSKKIYANQDDYATVYLFFQWLRIQGGDDIYKKIITSEHINHNAVVDNMNGFSAWDSLLETWLAANRIMSPSGSYGYKGELNVEVSYAPVSSTVKTISLYPGEGVYSWASSAPTITPNKGPNIVHKYITDNGVNPVHSSNTTLLTYNKDTSIVAPRSETGTVTGAAPPASASTSVVLGGRSASAPFAGPLRIDAGDLLRRNGKGESFSGFNLPMPLKESVVHE